MGQAEVRQKGPALNSVTPYTIEVQGYCKGLKVTGLLLLRPSKPATLRAGLVRVRRAVPRYLAPIGQDAVAGSDVLLV